MSNFLSNLFIESDAYSSLDRIEELLQEGMDFKHHPVQPLYLSLKSLSPEKASLSLAKFSKEQRTLFLDMDLWFKDSIDVQSFEYWIKSYAICPDEKIRLEFVSSEEFALFLKGRFNIWTFDVEDPLYPDHDFYFLTDDMQFLIEYDEDFEDVDSIKRLIREYYGAHGVENAYTYFFKIVSDTFSNAQETEYQLKKGRLSDIGMIDYFDALKVIHCFANIDVMNNFIKKKGNQSASLDPDQKNQVLHKSAIVAYRNGLESIFDELAKLKDEKRIGHVNFSFFRLVNSTLSVADAVKDGPIAMTRIGNATKAIILLGWAYICERSNGNIFAQFDFTEIYRVGNTLLSGVCKGVTKALKSNALQESDEGFIGGHLLEFVDNSFEKPTRYTPRRSKKAREILNVEIYKEWKEKAHIFMDLVPFIKQLYHTYRTMRDNGHLVDDYYLNYSVTEIDFEAILISSFGNHVVGRGEDKHKLGMTLGEFKKFASMAVNKDGKLNPLEKDLDAFEKKLGLDSVTNFRRYMITILGEQLEGYDYKSLVDDDFKHVGGPIILRKD